MTFTINEKSDDNLMLLYRIIRLSNKCIEFINEVGPKKYKKYIKQLNKKVIYLNINPRIHTFYAYVNVKDTDKNNIISFNAQYSKDINTFTDEQLLLIVAHETAHLLDFIVRGDSFHDNNWKIIAMYMGTEPNARLDISKDNILKKQKFNDNFKQLSLNQRRSLIKKSIG